MRAIGVRGIAALAAAGFLSEGEARYVVEFAAKDRAPALKAAAALARTVLEGENGLIGLLEFARGLIANGKVDQVLPVVERLLSADDAVLEGLGDALAARAFDAHAATERADVAIALGRIAARVPRAIRLLRALLGDRAPQVRLSALDALTRVRRPEARDALLSALRDPEERIFDAAVVALRRRRDHVAMAERLDTLARTERDAGRRRAIATVLVEERRRRKPQGES